MTLPSWLQRLLDFMRRQVRIPHKIPNPHPVKTDYWGHYATVSHKQRQSSAKAPNGLGTDWYITGTNGGVGIWRPNLVGIQHRIRWSELETSKGVYDFSIISHLLKECAGDGTAVHNCSGANGKVQALFMIEDKSFVDPTGAFGADDYYPAYLNTEGYASQFTGVNGYDSETLRWHPYVSGRFDLLIQAMAAWRDSYVINGFDVHPNFEGVVIQESAIGHADSVAAPAAPTAYTATLYATAIKAMIASINTNFSKSRALWFMNFITGGQTSPRPNKFDDIMNYMVSSTDHADFGGPDCLHGRTTLNEFGKTPEGPYQYYQDFASSLNAACSMQNDSYREVKSTTPTVYYTMEEQFYLAASYANPLNGGLVEDTEPFTDTTVTPNVTKTWLLNAKRVLWDFRAPNGAESDWSDAARVIDANGGFNSRAVTKF